MSMVTVPFALAFFLFGWSALLVSVLRGVCSASNSRHMPAAGKKVAIGMLTCQPSRAHGIAILFYEINVLAPSVVTAILY